MSGIDDAIATTKKLRASFATLKAAVLPKLAAFDELLAAVKIAQEVLYRTGPLGTANPLFRKADAAFKSAITNAEAVQQPPGEQP